ncbi:MAG: DUF2272 domain-containing protein [Acetobacteraceae bacterium]|nr:DUF2272 domain-containing protein [Acetobacteraceae bacterium]
MVCRLAPLLAAVFGVAACARPDAHVPPFARIPYTAPSRESIVSITLREWKAFGQPIAEASTQRSGPVGPSSKPEREPGLWQRVGEYWWLGLNAGAPESGWTGKHDGTGHIFPASADSEFAWSAAFVSYVMRMAGLGPHFPYAASHAVYIDIARQVASGATSGWFITAERPEVYAPRPGDLICLGRGSGRNLRYDDLPVGQFPAHCDIVVSTKAPDQIDVIGGNVDDSVALKHVPVTAEGTLATPNGIVLDSHHNWMVVIRMLVDTLPS